jgi:hypothetical protein
MGDPIIATGRLTGLQEILVNEVADETRSLGEAAKRTKCRWNWVQPRSSDGNLVQFWYSRRQKRGEIGVLRSSRVGKCSKIRERSQRARSSVG